MQDSDINQIINKEKQLLVRHDPVSLLIELIDDEFIEIGSSAKMYDKNEVTRWLNSGDKSELVGSDFKAKFLAENVVLLIYISRSKEDPLKESKQVLRASIWRRIDGNWRMVFHQGTTIV